jgi:NADH:ubiquinone oxidoreductase subunit 3 (subunit A)
VYEIYLYILISIVFESLGGMLYGVAVGFDPRLVFATTLIINILTVFAAIFLVGRLLEWKKGIRRWIERRTARGQRLINKYAWIGIIAGVFVLSPVQIAIIGRLLGIHPSKFYPPLIVGTVLGALVSMGIALGIFKLILRW